MHGREATDDQAAKPPRAPAGPPSTSRARRGTEATKGSPGRLRQRHPEREMCTREARAQWLPSCVASRPFLNGDDDLLHQRRLTNLRSSSVSLRLSSAAEWFTPSQPNGAKNSSASISESVTASAPPSLSRRTISLTHSSSFDMALRCWRRLAHRSRRTPIYSAQKSEPPFRHSRRGRFPPVPASGGHCSTPTQAFLDVQ